MNIFSSAISNNLNVFQKSQYNKKSTPSFGAIFVEDIVDLGKASQGKNPARFLKSDALLLNKIAQEYPNQDCFIRKGHAGYPRLEYRERPPQVQEFTETMFKQYQTSLDPEDNEYPCEQLILKDDSKLNRFIGMTSFISLNPSLPFTVKAGFEVHKKLLEKKYQIKEIIGKNDSVNIGGESITQRAHKEIEDIEIAVTRYLMESAYTALTDRATGSQIYESEFPKVQSVLDSERRLDLTTSVAKQPTIEPDKLQKEKFDICEYATQKFPNKAENKKRINELEHYLSKHGIVLN